jgi:SAM-dependent methyltransferase
MNYWTSAEFAEEQEKIVSQELARAWPGVYHEFEKALQGIGKRDTLLDIGCGVGGYGFVCAKSFPLMRYTGSDISTHMIERARRRVPNAKFKNCEFFDNKTLDYDVVLTSSTIEYTRDPWDALAYLLREARGSIILHRLHMTADKSHDVNEPSYCGHNIAKMHWNRDDIMGLIQLKKRSVSYESLWARGQMLTLVIDKMEL